MRQQRFLPFVQYCEHRLSEFVDEFLKIENEDRKWEFYLHKVYDKSFEEWNKSIPKPKESISDEQLETTTGFQFVAAFRAQRRLPCCDIRSTHWFTQRHKM